MGNFAFNPFSGLLQLYPLPTTRIILIVDSNRTLTPDEFIGKMIAIRAENEGGVEITLPDPSLVEGYIGMIKVIVAQYGFTITEQIDGEPFECTGTGDIIYLTSDGSLYYRI